MARPKEFDRQATLDRAMRLFWQQGYVATSIQDLVDATGVNRASMYGTFGDKHRLFLAAIERYVGEITATLLDQLRAPGSGRAALHRYLEGIVRFAEGEGPRLGCLVTNSAVEMAPRDAEIAAFLRASLGAVEEALFDAIRRAQAQGEIAANRDARALARFLLGVIQGVLVLARARSDGIVLRDVVGIALSALD